MSDYRHGAYAIFLDSGITIAVKSGTLPVYFGTAPIHQLEDPAGKTGVPVLLTGYPQVQQKSGYSDN